MNLPNKITVFRVCMIPVFLVFMLVPGIPGGRYVAAAIFIIASASDFLDGYLARKNNLVTDFGKFMDPLADKLLVCSALICFVEIGSVPAWVVILIIAREFTISGFRLVAAGNHIVIAANSWGKIKTVVQMVMCVFFILDLDGTFFEVSEQILLYTAVLLTVISLVDYIYANRRVITEGTK
ncbi:MAG: CDP-diacylglycerol--glycerol-3-phosphate 3-phosphatidyltransferase [Lachnospiraceae bacterium]|nr:CDP-diacylglycerol--glycerol-3-phosphate 3-phosphatidyltransferase [Lachnospiraceae bacterium]